MKKEEKKSSYIVDSYDFVLKEFMECILSALCKISMKFIHTVLIKKFNSCINNCIFKYLCLFLGVSLPDFDNKTLAVLRGRIVRYLIQSKEVSKYISNSFFLTVFFNFILKTKKI